jgi:hypothetical protein
MSATITVLETFRRQRGIIQPTSLDIARARVRDRLQPYFSTWEIGTAQAEVSRLVKMRWLVHDAVERVVEDFMSRLPETDPPLPPAA